MARPKKVEDHQEPDGIELIPMRKDGETIEVNPACVKAHQEAGWRVVEDGELE